MAYKDGTRDMPMDYNIPRHMLCRICGQCSTAINPQMVCWRHKEYGEDGVMYYLGKVEVIQDKGLPTPIVEIEACLKNPQNA